MRPEINLFLGTLQYTLSLVLAKELHLHRTTDWEDTVYSYTLSFPEYDTMLKKYTTSYHSIAVRFR